MAQPLTIPQRTEFDELFANCTEAVRDMLTIAQSGGGRVREIRLTVADNGDVLPSVLMHGRSRRSRRKTEEKGIIG